MKYTVVLERGPTSWGAHVPDLAGVIAVGETRDEVEKEIAEAIRFHLDGLREEGLAIPPPASIAAEIEVPAA